MQSPFDINANETVCTRMSLRLFLECHALDCRRYFLLRESSRSSLLKRAEDKNKGLLKLFFARWKEVTFEFHCDYCKTDFGGRKRLPKGNITPCPGCTLTLDRIIKKHRTFVDSVGGYYSSPFL